MIYILCVPGNKLLFIEPKMLNIPSNLYLPPYEIMALD